MLQFIRQMPTFKSRSDLPLFLRRFEAYQRAIACPPAELRNLLVQLLDDKSLSSIDCVVIERLDIPFEELVQQLRRAEG